MSKKTILIGRLHFDSDWYIEVDEKMVLVDHYPSTHFQVGRHENMMVSVILIEGICNQILNVMFL